MKVLLFTDSLGPGGAQRQLVGLGIMMREYGMDVKLITYHNLSFYKPVLDENNVPNELLPGANIKRRRLKVFCAYVKDESPDCVIAYQETPSLLACCAKIIVGRFRLLVSERNTTQKESLRDKIRFLLFRKADVIIPNSYSQARFLNKNYPRLTKKIHTITNYVDLDKFCPVCHYRNNPPVVLVVGSIWSSKNTKAYIWACRKLIERGYCFKTILLGWTEQPNNYMEEVADLVSYLRLESIVSIHNKVLDVVPYYHSADYYCIPSLFEGTPNVLCEAIACGLPVAASNVCDNSLYVKEGRNGTLFDPTSPDLIADAIQRLFDLSDNDYSSYCIESRKLAEELLSPIEFLRKYLEVLS